MKRIIFIIFIALTFIDGDLKGGSSRIRRNAEIPLLSPQTVFHSGEEGYSCYRIPAIVQAKDGSLLAFAEGRRFGKSDAGDIDLVMKCSTDNGRTWSGISVVWDDGGNTCGNPAPVVLDDGKIVLLATWNKGEDKEKDIEKGLGKDTRRVFVMFSDDDGKTWSEPEEVTSDVKKPDWGWYATGPCHAIVKKKEPHKGRIIIPSNHSEISEDGKPVSKSQIIWSDDRGGSWHLGGITEINGNESTVAELSDGSLLLNMRRFSKADTVRYEAVSRDGGESFSREYKTGLIGPRCQGSILSISDRRSMPTDKVVFCNPCSSAKREKLSLRISDDGGKTYIRTIGIFAGPSAYSDIVQLSGNVIGVLFENGDEEFLYRKISFTTVSID